jgi:hypothetical protein
MLRFQEHFESPRFRGRHFSRKEFESWYRKKNGRWDYYQYWDGFNFPSHVLRDFYKGKFAELTHEERQVLNFFSDQKDSSFYVIALAKKADPLTLAHEFAHALYFLNSDYRQEVQKLMAGFPCQKVEKFLFEKMGDYHPNVLPDEAHAWLMHNSRDLAADGLNLKPYRQLIPALKKIYRRYISSWSL